MSRKRLLFSGFSVVLTLWVVSAGIAQESHQIDPEMMEAYMKLNAPNENHEFLKNFVGEWVVTTTAWMQPGAEPISSVGTAKAAMIIGGRFLKVDFKGKIPFSSKVIPVNESFSTQQWVLPAEQVIEILRNARSFALTSCECRERYQRCENPLDVCFIINDEADKYVTEKKARHITIEEAEEVLHQANNNGLVHLTLNKPEQHVFEGIGISFFASSIILYQFPQFSPADIPE